MSPQQQQFPTRMTAPAMAHQTPPPCAKPGGRRAEGHSVSRATRSNRARPAADGAGQVPACPTAAPKHPTGVKRAEGVSRPTATRPARARPANPEVRA